MEFRVLGQVEVIDNDQPIPLGGPKQRTVLGLLAAYAGRAVSVDRLIDALWGDEPPDKAKASIQTHISNLRGLIGDRIEFVGDGYSLQVDTHAVDASKFEELVDRGRDLVDSEPSRAAAMLSEALVLWRGTPFSDLDVPALRPVVTALEEKRLIALESRIAADLARGRDVEVIGELEALCEEHPLRERFRYLHMLALYRAGRQVEALRSYEKTRTHLAEIGIEPSEELADLEQQILEHSPSLRRARPVPETSASPRPLLPRPRTRLIGRDDDVKELSRLIGEHRLITLTGVGGSGKTRLALEVGTLLESDPEGSVFFIDLSALNDTDDLSGEMSRQMGIVQGAFGAVADPLDELVANLTGQQTVLIVDNCEHVLDACATVVDELLTRSETVSVLATSREPLSLGGEHVWPVRSLPADASTGGAAVELLSERIEEIRPDFDSKSSRDELTVIARRLDGLPLALELAAPRVAHLGPKEVLARLDDRFRLLVGGRRRASRQQTLEATLDWSHDLLRAPERTLLRRLAVFSGDFDLEAVENVASQPNEETSGLLGSLVDKSIVTLDYSDGAPRYRLLETVRAYAEERLMDSGESAEIRSRHRDWYLSWLKRHGLDGALNDFRVVDRLEVEYDNLRAAIRWSLETGSLDGACDQLTYMLGLVYFRAHHEEAKEWASHIMKGAGPEAEAHAIGRIALEFCYIHNRDARHDTQEDPYPDALIEALESLPEHHPARFVACHALWAVGSILMDVQGMIHWAAEARRAAQMSGMPRGEVFATGLEACSYLFGHEYNRAAEMWYEVELRTWNPALTLFLVATASYLANDTTRARDVIDNAGWDPSNPDLCLGEMGVAIAHASLGDLGSARLHMTEAAHAVRRMRWARPRAKREVLVGLALITLLEDDLETAMRHIAAARSGTTTHITGTPGGVVLWQHCSEILKERLDPETRSRLIGEGKRIDVDKAIDEQLARSKPSQEDF